MNQNKTDLILFDKKHILLLCCLICFFVLAVLFKVHGYSISHWKNYFFVTEKPEIIFGLYRPIRSDDWAVEIPLMLGQLAHNPKYPLINENIGNGLNMSIYSKVPIKSSITLFRPTVWGFFLGRDHGLSWMWWTMTIGFFYVYFLLLSTSFVHK